jgi:hypothetical protein
MFVCGVGLAYAERRLSEDKLERGPLGIGLILVAGTLGALFFGAELVRHHDPAWPGFVGGVICGLIAALATRPLLARVRGRLDASAAAAVPFWAEAAALLLAVLAVLAPPVGPIALVLLLWLLLAGRRREGQKYAGLRILR